METFWSRDVTDIQVLAHFEFKTPNCFKNFPIYFRDICPKKIRQEKNLNYIKMNRYSQKILNYIKCQND